MWAEYSGDDRINVFLLSFYLSSIELIKNNKKVALLCPLYFDGFYLLGHIKSSEVKCLNAASRSNIHPCKWDCYQVMSSCAVYSCHFVRADCNTFTCPVARAVKINALNQSKFLCTS